MAFFFLFGVLIRKCIIGGHSKRGARGRARGKGGRVTVYDYEGQLYPLLSGSLIDDGL